MPSFASLIRPHVDSELRAALLAESQGNAITRQSLPPHASY
jgi:hypothetical protein